MKFYLCEGALEFCKRQLDIVLSVIPLEVFDVGSV